MKSKTTLAILSFLLITFSVKAQIRVTTNNNVGIGNMTNPVSLLELENNKWIRLNPVTGTAGILFYKSGTSTSTSVQYGGKLYYDGSLDQLRLGTMENNTFREALDIKRSTGEIGMGISPIAGYQLYIKGKTMIWGDEFRYCKENGNPYPRIVFNNNSTAYAELGAYSTTPIGQLGTTAHQWSEIRGVSIYANGIEVYSDARLKESEISRKSRLRIMIRGPQIAMSNLNTRRIIVSSRKDRSTGSTRSVSLTMIWVNWSRQPILTILAQPTVTAASGNSWRLFGLTVPGLAGQCNGPTRARGDSL